MLINGGKVFIVLSIKIKYQENGQKPAIPAITCQNPPTEQLWRVFGGFYENLNPTQPLNFSPLCEESLYFSET